MLKTLIPAVLVAVAASGAADAKTRNESPGDYADAIFADAVAIQQLLAADSIAGVDTLAADLAAVARAAAEEADDPQLLGEIADAADALGAADDLKHARNAFGTLSAPVVRYRDAATGPRPHVAYCPMADKEWLQSGDAVANPYFGSGMLRCGSIVRR